MIAVGAPKSLSSCPADEIIFPALSGGPFCDSLSSSLLVVPAWSLLYARMRENSGKFSLLHPTE